MNDEQPWGPVSEWPAGFLSPEVWGQEHDPREAYDRIAARMRGGRGRGDEQLAVVAASGAGVGVPVAEDVDGRSRPMPYAERTPGAQALVDAARRLLVRGGFDALRLEAIAAESGQNKAMIRYWFGDKAGLLAALVDDLTHDATTGLLERAESLPPGPGRLHRHLELARGVMEQPEFATFFDVLPHAVRDPQLRPLINELYTWYREINVRCFGGEVTPETRREYQGLASLLMAAVDGIAIQIALDPEGFDPDLCFEILETWLRESLGRLSHEGSAT